MPQICLFNDDWKFHLGDAPGADAAAYDTAGWRAVTLPHDFSIEAPFDPRWASATGFLPGGVGWYRKSFTRPDAPAEGRVFLHFDGVYQNSEVWMNGHFLGKRPSGFASFRYDISAFLNPGGENVIAVKADHALFADARWYTGSGIYRDVFLVETSLVHVRQWGISVTTPTVTADRAEVAVKAVIQNHAETAASVQVAFALQDAAGTVVAEGSADAAVPAGGEQAVSVRLAITQPKRWSVETPHLYTLSTEVLVNGAVTDREETAIGLRSFHFDAADGFFLNDEPLKLKGVCVHDDAGALGTAVPIKVWERRLRALQAAGVNAVRMAHNPHLPALYDLCDQMGLLVQDEAFDEWELGKRKWISGWNVGEAGTDGPFAHFGEWGETDLREMVQAHRNHPSIIMWSIGNEIDYPNDPYTHEILDMGNNPQIYGSGFYPGLPHSNRLGVIAAKLAAVVRECDPTRPVTAALSAASVSNETGFADALDVVGYNYQEYRYPEDHTKYPDRVLYGSENGMRTEFWAAVADNPFISGQFLWTGIDYLGEAGKWPLHGSSSGLLDLAGLPKPEYHFRRALWTTEPMIALGTSAQPDGSETVALWTHKGAVPVWGAAGGSLRRVSGYTNCARAELFLNGQSLGVKTPTEDGGHVVSWDVTYAPGTLTVHGLDTGGGIIATDTLQTSGPAAVLSLEADTDTLQADGLDLAHVLVSVRDAAGTLVYDAAHEIAWNISGPARLLGLENGDLGSLEDYRTSRDTGVRRVHQGRLIGYVQSMHAAGPITVTVTASGLAPATLNLVS